MLKSQPFSAGKTKVRGSFSIFKCFQTVNNVLASSFSDQCMSIVFSSYDFLMGPQNSKSLKYWANDKPGFMTGLFYNTKILLKA